MILAYKFSQYDRNQLAMAAAILRKSAVRQALIECFKDMAAVTLYIKTEKKRPGLEQNWQNGQRCKKKFYGRRSFGRVGGGI